MLFPGRLRKRIQNTEDRILSSHRRGKQCLRCWRIFSFSRPPRSTKLFKHPENFLKTFRQICLYRNRFFVFAGRCEFYLHRIWHHPILIRIFSKSRHLLGTLYSTDFVLGVLSEVLLPPRFIGILPDAANFICLALGIMWFYFVYIIKGSFVRGSLYKLTIQRFCNRSQGQNPAFDLKTATL